MNQDTSVAEPDERVREHGREIIPRLPQQLNHHQADSNGYNHATGFGRNRNDFRSQFHESLSQNSPSNFSGLPQFCSRIVANVKPLIPSTRISHPASGRPESRVPQGVYQRGNCDQQQQQASSCKQQQEQAKSHEQHGKQARSHEQQGEQARSHEQGKQAKSHEEKAEQAKSHEQEETKSHEQGCRKQQEDQERNHEQGKQTKSHEQQEEQASSHEQQKKLTSSHEQQKKLTRSHEEQEQKAINCVQEHVEPKKYGQVRQQEVNHHERVKWLRTCPELGLKINNLPVNADPEILRAALSSFNTGNSADDQPIRTEVINLQIPTKISEDAWQATAYFREIDHVHLVAVAFNGEKHQGRVVNVSYLDYSWTLGYQEDDANEAVFNRNEFDTKNDLKQKSTPTEFNHFISNPTNFPMQETGIRVRVDMLPFCENILEFKKLKSDLHKKFEAFGKIQVMDFMSNGRIVKKKFKISKHDSMKFSSAEFYYDDYNDAVNATVKMNGSKFNNESTITVSIWDKVKVEKLEVMDEELGNSADETNCWYVNVSGLRNDTTLTEIHGLFNLYGNIKNIKLNKKEREKKEQFKYPGKNNENSINKIQNASASIYFDTREEACNAKSAIVLNGCSINIFVFQPSVLVYNWPISSVSFEECLEKFEKVAPIDRNNCTLESDTVRIVYMTSGAAECAAMKFNDTKIFQDNTIRVVQEIDFSGTPKFL